MKMQKILSGGMILLCSCLNTSAHAEKKTVLQWGGETHKSGPDTYKIVKENEAHTNLHCEQPGTNSCCWASGEDPLIIVGGNPLLMSEAYKYVLAMVAQNVFTGSVTDDNGINGYSWTASAPGNLEFIFDGR